MLTNIFDAAFQQHPTPPHTPVVRRIYAPPMVIRHTSKARHTPISPRCLERDMWINVLETDICLGRMTSMQQMNGNRVKIYIGNALIVADRDFKVIRGKCDKVSIHGMHISVDRISWAVYPKWQRAAIGPSGKISSIFKDALARRTCYCYRIATRWSIRTLWVLPGEPYNWACAAMASLLKWTVVVTS